MFYERLQSLCKDKEEKLTNVLKTLELSTGATGRWKNGTLPEGKVLIMLSDYFGVTTDYILGRSEKQTPPNISNVTNSAVAQGNNSNAVNDKSPMTTKESELFHIFKMLDIKAQNKILANAHQLEEEFVEANNGKGK